jgi:hypothetical protein
MNSAINVLTGWSVGYTFTEGKNKEDEIKQGKNYYLSGLTIAAQLGQLGVLIQKINSIFPTHFFKTPINLMCNIVPLLSVPALGLCAAAKHGNYQNVAHFYNNTRFSFIKLPENLKPWAKSAMNFVVEHGGDIIRVAMVTGAVGFIALGNTAYGVALLAAIGYEVVDKLGFVPRRISLFMEIYMPIVSMTGMLLGGTLVMRIFSAISLPSLLSPNFNRYMHHKVDACIRYFFNMKSVSLEEIDSPVVEQNTMKYDEINRILNAKKTDFEMIPNHCGKLLIDLDKLPTDREFDQFLSLYDKIEWGTKFSLISNKLKDDDRFIDFLSEKNPDIDKEDLKKDVVKYIEELAVQDLITKEKYAADWIRNQMVSLVDNLTGRKRVKGLQQDLAEAMDDCSIILPYLKGLNDPIELEDALLKLAVEGGDYCGRGIKRAANELIRGIIQGCSQSIEEGDDKDVPVRNYELEILQTLQIYRHDIIQGAYKAMMHNGNVPNVMSDDVHGFDTYRMYFALGFYPLTRYERNRMGLAELGVWEIYSSIRKAMYSDYQDRLDEAITEVGEARFGVYIPNIIQNNDQLTDDEKDELMDKFINNDQWTAEETKEKFHRLLLVKLGVLRLKEAAKAA